MGTGKIKVTFYADEDVASWLESIDSGIRSREINAALRESRMQDINAVGRLEQIAAAIPFRPGPSYSPKTLHRIEVLEKAVAEIFIQLEQNKEARGHAEMTSTSTEGRLTISRFGKDWSAVWFSGPFKTGSERAHPPKILTKEQVQDLLKDLNISQEIDFSKDVVFDDFLIDAPNEALKRWRLD